MHAHNYNNGYWKLQSGMYTLYFSNAHIPSFEATSNEYSKSNLTIALIVHFYVIDHTP